MVAIRQAQERFQVIPASATHYRKPPDRSALAPRTAAVGDRSAASAARSGSALTAGASTWPTGAGALSQLRPGRIACRTAAVIGWGVPVGDPPPFLTVHVVQA